MVLGGVAGMEFRALGGGGVLLHLSDAQYTYVQLSRRWRGNVVFTPADVTTQPLRVRQ